MVKVNIGERADFYALVSKRVQHHGKDRNPAVRRWRTYYSLIKAGLRRQKEEVQIPHFKNDEVLKEMTDVAAQFRCSIRVGVNHTYIGLQLLYDDIEKMIEFTLYDLVSEIYELKGYTAVDWAGFFEKYNSEKRSIRDWNEIVGLSILYHRNIIDFNTYMFSVWKRGALKKADFYSDQVEAMVSKLNCTYPEQAMEELCKDPNWDAEFRKKR